MSANTNLTTDIELLPLNIKLKLNEKISNIKSILLNIEGYSPPFKLTKKITDFFNPNLYTSNIHHQVLPYKKYFQERLGQKYFKTKKSITHISQEEKKLP